MRRAGTVTDLRGLGPHDHVCWGYDDEAEFRTAAVSFLDAGLAMGQRVCYVGHAEEEVRAALTGTRPGAVVVLPLDAQYATGTTMDPLAQVSAYEWATKEALAAGFTGLRVAADITALVGTPAHLDVVARYEYRVDHLMVREPMSAMCAYDRAVVGAEALTELASMHPAAAGAVPPFRLHASSLPGCAAAIGGEVDFSDADLFRRALDRADLRPRDGELVLDATGLTFIDAARLAAVAEHARRLGAALVLRTGQHVPIRLVRLLDWDDVRIEAA